MLREDDGVTMLSRAVQEMEEDWGFRGFEEGLRSWIATVAIVEVGFYGVGEDYWHELTARDYLAELRRRSGSDWPPAWDGLIAPWDERFRSATVEQEEPMLPSPDYETGWWQYRRPLKWEFPPQEPERPLRTYEYVYRRSGEPDVIESIRSGGSSVGDRFAGPDAYWEIVEEGPSERPGYAGRMVCMETSYPAPHRGELFRAYRELREEWNFASFEAALRSWIATVVIVEAGYEGAREEYARELLARDYLAELRRRSGSDWPASWDGHIDPWDERFRAATVEREEPHSPSPDHETGWWHYRIPRQWVQRGSQDGSSG